MSLLRISEFILHTVAFALLLWAATSQAETDKGLQIARMMAAQQDGFGNYQVDMEMVLVDIGGRETIRRLRVSTREVQQDGDQSLAVFDAPADVKGTAFLSHTHINRADDQWLYLPALKRVKRISPANKTAPFMGSEFSYEDLTSYEVDNFTYQYIGEEKLDGMDCYILDRFPTSEFSGYSRQRVWVEKDRYLALKIEYYSKKNEKLKTLTSLKFNQYLNRFWFAHEMLMQNHISRKSSLLFWKNYQFRQPLREADFDPNSLPRIR